MIKYYNIDQKTDEWLEIRKGKFTASHAQAIANADKWLDSLCIELLSEKFALKSDKYTNDDIERGNELEDEARQEFIEWSKLPVTQVGFVTNSKYKNAGCSPDGMIGYNSLVEIKCPNNLNYFKLLLEPTVKPEYMWQIQMQLLITEYEHCYYVCYNPNFEKKLVVIDVLPNKEMQNKIIAGIKTGNKKLIELNNKLT